MSSQKYIMFPVSEQTEKKVESKEELLSLLKDKKDKKKEDGKEGKGINKKLTTFQCS